MKKITLLCFAFIALAFNLQINAQCTGTYQYPIGDLVGSTVPGVFQVSDCNFNGDYSVITGLALTEDYEFANVDGGYITIIDNTDGITVLDSGASPFAWTATVGDVQIHWHADVACGTDAACHVTTMECTTCIAPPGPANDLCGDATVLNCDDVVAFDTTNANLDDAVTCGTTAFSNNVWFTYQGDGSTAEIITLSTCNDADYDTKIFVYEGDCGSLVCVANNDDFTGCAGFSSQLEFVSDGSTIYKISVNGYNLPDGSFVSAGSGNLSITCSPAPVPPANDDCADAQGLTFGVTVTGDNTNATSAIANPSCDPFGVISDVWYSFQASATLAAEITTTANGTADEAQFAVYDACGGTEIGCSNVGGLLKVEPLVNGATYYVQVWNDGATARLTEGTFDIVVVEASLSTTDFDNDLEFTYYPNPVTNNLTLNAQNNIDSVVAYNMLGQEVLRTNPNQVNSDLNMSELQSGTYFVKVSINGQTETIKIIKN